MMGNPRVTAHVTELHTPGARTLRDAPFEASGLNETCRSHRSILERASRDASNNLPAYTRQTTFKRDIIPIIHNAYASPRAPQTEKSSC
ncbi:hypothetical protein KUIN1_06070 [Pseudomonas sp. KUIN-1]|nr:hypothetical protein KUIN1_06070 [Pseudomonas sp. KUIN-1]